MITRSYEPLVDRLATKFTVGDGCWEWTASVNSSGYGSVRVDGHKRLAHRVMYALLVGPIPEGLQLDHLCRNARCVRPSHLEPVTQQENMRRGLKGVLTTHCPRGHPYSGDNLYLNERANNRMCRACRKRPGAREPKENPE